MRIEDCVKMRLINKANLRPMEVCVPWHGDIVVVYRIPMTDDGEESKDMVINEGCLDLIYKGDKVKMHMKAKKNVEAPIMGDYGFPGLKIVTNESGYFGAAVLLHPDAPKFCKEKAGGNCFVIPSSIHEVLILPAEDFEATELVDTIKTVNSTVVRPEDRLSDMVYFCDGNQFYEYTEYQNKVIKEKEEQIEFQGLIIRAVIS